MKLSEAILLGSMTLKAKCGIFDDGEEGCALGMANRAIGGRVSDQRHNETWPWLAVMPVSELPCGCSGRGLMGGGGFCSMDESGLKYSVWNTIVHLFNQHVCDGSWTIEQLADWVRSVEPADLPAEPLAAAPAEQQAETVTQTGE